MSSPRAYGPTCIWDLRPSPGPHPARPPPPPPPLLPAFGDLPDALDRVGGANPWWLVAALGFEAISFLGHIVLFRAVAVDGDNDRIGMRASTEITFAGHAATRLFATAGAGGVALTAWAMRKSGMTKRDVASRMTTFLV